MIYVYNTDNQSIKICLKEVLQPPFTLDLKSTPTKEDSFIDVVDIDSVDFTNVDTGMYEYSVIKDTVLYTGILYVRNVDSYKTDNSDNLEFLGIKKY